ncbi:MAG: hypothetical protein QM780_05960 [Hyphomicrobium sp.]|uniref:hypothetical protein n=1 Tax=Hyphomicrobium sp. TaxID=82 RepID=UPI0039E481A5
MNRLSFSTIFAAMALLAAAAGPSQAQQFEYTPYRGFNNTGQQPTDPPPDNYTPMHQGAAAGAPASPGAAAGSQDDGSDAYRGGNARATTSSGGSYAPPPSAYTPRAGSYSPSEDVYSPARTGGGEPPSASPPPRGVGGPPAGDFDARLPRIEVQAAAPDDGLPFEVRQHDAREAAIEGWSSKVADRFGPEFSQWRLAADKHVDCHNDRSDGVICTASGQPVRGSGPGGPPPRNGRY